MDNWDQLTLPISKSKDARFEMCNECGAAIFMGCSEEDFRFIRNTYKNKHQEWHRRWHV